MNKKQFVIANLFALVLLTVVFAPLSSQQGVHDYDPWADLNDDGKIDGRDIAELSAKFGTLGTPINKTELLLELIQKIELLNTTVLEMQNTINYLSNTVVYLNETVVYLNNTGLGAPDYDSGWFTLPYWGSVTLTHNLGTKDIIVYLMGKYPNSQTLTVRGFGGDGGYTNDGRKYGTWWDCADVNTISVMNDNWGSGGEYWFGEARILLWRIP